ncbi:pyridoxamine 5'-phosphate oxidase family protein [Ideonella sp. A 288]|uniref:pyridoxamine 5'-phosphate oxidase family protein n=1 Tax=Ideonella sp. A 288 TaxID=1962181 RepID=UPI000B4C1068|nr:pyridoxamine 5'-phosphate oxidase family protein [Ideonella sp. A 288]
MDSRIETLGLIQSACWRELERASRENDHEWRVMSMATLGGDGLDLRSMVLREVREQENRLTMYTDARSPKVGQIDAQPQAMLLAWSRRLGWQLRLKVDLSIETAGLAVSSRWAQLKMTPAAQDYLSPLPPGAVLEGIEPERATRGHFALIHGKVSAMDWLELHPDGRRRAMFDTQGMRWLAP